MDLSHLGEVQKDGSIILHDRNIKFRNQMSGEYPRIRQTAKQKNFLAKNGLQHILSSFISAAGTNDNKLYIRFHNDSLYEYPNQAHKFDDLMKSNSKGQYFNKNIRPTKNYKKLASLPFPDGGGLTISDNELFEQIDVKVLTNLVKDLQGSRLVINEVLKGGIAFNRVQINDLVYFIPLIRN